MPVRKELRQAPQFAHEAIPQRSSFRIPLLTSELADRIKAAIAKTEQASVYASTESLICDFQDGVRVIVTMGNGEWDYRIEIDGNIVTFESASDKVMFQGEFATGINRISFMPLSSNQNEYAVEHGREYLQDSDAQYDVDLNTLYLSRTSLESGVTISGAQLPAWLIDGFAQYQKYSSEIESTLNTLISLHSQAQPLPR